jgi:hypothetical protein
MTLKPIMKDLYEIQEPAMKAQMFRNAVRYEYFRDGSFWHSGIRFNRAVAMRAYAELYAKRWAGDAEDTLVEVENSDWLEEMRARDRPPGRDPWDMHHYLISFDDHGSYECIAESWEALPEERGKLPVIPGI